MSDQTEENKNGIEIDWENYDLSAHALPAETPLPEAPEGYELISTQELAELKSAQRQLVIKTAVLDQIFEAVKKQEDKMREWTHYKDSQSPDRVKALINRMEHGSQAQYHNIMAFRNQALTQFNALQIVVQMCLMGGTHHEKNARLRGLADTISIAIEKITEVSERYFTQVNWRWNLLESDSSLPTLQRRNWHLEEELKEYREKYGVLKEETETEEQDDYSPF